MALNVDVLLKKPGQAADMAISTRNLLLLDIKDNTTVFAFKRLIRDTVHFTTKETPTDLLLFVRMESPPLQQDI